MNQPLQTPLLRVDDVSLTYPAAVEPALDRVSLALRFGRLILVGESGAGKSSLLRVAAGLAAPSTGLVQVAGINPYTSRRTSLAVRRKLGLVQQEPRASLPPFRTAMDCVAEPLVVLGGLGWDEARARAEQQLLQLELPAGRLSALPQNLSGGECQRVSLARALIRPISLLLADEVTANLDPELGRHIATLVSAHVHSSSPRENTQVVGPGLVWVTHRLQEAVLLGGTVAVMLRGRVIELFEPFSGWEHARHPYTCLLLDPYGTAAATRSASSGDCAFLGRCAFGEACLGRGHPPLIAVCESHSVACWKAGERAEP